MYRSIKKNKLLWRDSQRSKDLHSIPINSAWFKDSIMKKNTQISPVSMMTWKFLDSDSNWSL